LDEYEHVSKRKPVSSKVEEKRDNIEMHKTHQNTQHIKTAGRIDTGIHQGILERFIPELPFPLRAVHVILIGLVTLTRRTFLHRADTVVLLLSSQ
jgi:hypothetical protein